MRPRLMACRATSSSMAAGVMTMPIISSGMPRVATNCAAPQATPVMDRNLQENPRERGEERTQPGPAAEPADTPSPDRPLRSQLSEEMMRMVDTEPIRWNSESHLCADCGRVVAPESGYQLYADEG